MKKISIIIGVLILAGAGFYFYTQNSKKAIAPNSQEQNSETKDTNSLETQVATNDLGTEPEQVPELKKPAPSTFSDGSEAEGMAPDILVSEIVYDGKAFSPSTLNIKVGDIVVFRNKSGGDMWPASAPHPTHTDYPEFDPKEPIASGAKWQFTFLKSGNWKFHDHLNFSVFGTVNVSAR